MSRPIAIPQVHPKNVLTYCLLSSDCHTEIFAGADTQTMDVDGQACSFNLYDVSDLDRNLRNMAYGEANVVLLCYSAQETADLHALRRDVVPDVLVRLMSARSAASPSQSPLDHSPLHSSLSSSNSVSSSATSSPFRAASFAAAGLELPPVILVATDCHRRDEPEEGMENKALSFAEAVELLEFVSPTTGTTVDHHGYNLR